MTKRDIKIIDMHCDTLLKILENGRQADSLVKNEWHVDLQRLRKSGYIMQFFAVFIEMCIFSPKTAEDEGYQRAHKMLDIFDKACETYSELLTKVTDYAGMKKAAAQNQIAGLVTLEEAGILKESLERINALYDRGIRLMTLTWNDENCIGYPNSTNVEIMNKGLKKFGIEAVRYMNEKGILVDVSHLNDGGFWDVARYSSKPFVASHSNCRAVTDHPRNLTDEMLRAIAEKGGLVGLNFNPPFLGKGTEGSSPDALIAHVNHMINTAGADVIALGTDYDGIHGNIAVPNAGEMYRLADALSEAGYNDCQIDKILYGNAERFLKENLS